MMGRMDEAADAIARSRLAKARILAKQCIERGLDASVVERLEVDGRDALAGLAGVAPASESTWGLVVDLLRTVDELRRAKEVSDAAGRGR